MEFLDDLADFFDDLRERYFYNEGFKDGQRLVKNAEFQDAYDQGVFDGVADAESD